MLGWAVQGDLDPSTAVSNTFTMAWPPHSGVFETFPEIDRVEWFARQGTPKAEASPGSLPRSATGGPHTQPPIADHRRTGRPARADLPVTGSLLALACFLPGGIAAGRLASRFGDNRQRQLRAATVAQLVLFDTAVAVAAAAGDAVGTAGRYTLRRFSRWRWVRRTPPPAASPSQT